MVDMKQINQLLRNGFSTQYNPYSVQCTKYMTYKLEKIFTSKELKLILLKHIQRKHKEDKHI